MPIRSICLASRISIPCRAGRVPCVNPAAPTCTSLRQRACLLLATSRCPTSETQADGAHTPTRSPPTFRCPALGDQQCLHQGRPLSTVYLGGDPSCSPRADRRLASRLDAQFGLARSEIAWKWTRPLDQSPPHRGCRGRATASSLGGQSFDDAVLEDAGAAAHRRARLPIDRRWLAQAQRRGRWQAGGLRPDSRACPNRT